MVNKFDAHTKFSTLNKYLLAKPNLSLKHIFRFESGNLERAVKITDTYYELHLR